MTSFNAIPAAEILAERRLTHTKGDRLAETIRPKTLAEGFAVQQQVLEYWCSKRADKVAGWKCLLPPEGKWVVAPIYGSTVFEATRSANIWPSNGLARIEPEFAFELGNDIPARSESYSKAEIDQCISEVRMALELIEGRYIDPSLCEFPELLADGLFNQGLVVGPVVDRTLAYAAANIDISMRYGDGEPQRYEGKHQNQDAIAPLYWLVNFLRAQGVPLQHGQFIITGSYAGIIEAPLDTDITMSYCGLGEMSTRFSAW
ncbi:hydratase [Simiduia litorea]|uniref:hydratase n=1 Tax=Simiduia litorea TaxID=1435348 RepID=UPI0036F4257E